MRWSNMRKRRRWIVAGVLALLAGASVVREDWSESRNGAITRRETRYAVAGFEGDVWGTEWWNPPAEIQPTDYRIIVSRRYVYGLVKSRDDERCFFRTVYYRPKP